MMVSEIEQHRNPAKIFQNAWSTYQKVLENNYMFHREIYRGVQGFIEQRYQRHPIKVLELGCGDASQTVVALSHCRVSLYQGCDLSEVALQHADQHLAALDCEVRLVCAHMLDSLAQGPGEFDVVFSSFVLHHLNLDEKKRFFSLSRDTLNDDGVLLLIDVMREEDEDRPTYLRAYLDHAAKHWQALNKEELLAVRSHIEDNDFPETASTYAAIAQETGFSRGHQLNQYTWHRTWYFHR